jgi:hypothetical protein
MGGVSGAGRRYVTHCGAAKGERGDENNDGNESEGEDANPLPERLPVRALVEEAGHWVSPLLLVNKHEG